MSRKSRKKSRFLEQHTLCCFCGGSTTSEEIDHLPSRSCFDNRCFPDGFEFPACHTCNASTKEEEQAVALLSRVHSHPDAPAIPAEIGRYTAGVANNNPDVIVSMISETASISGREGVFRLGDPVHQAFDSVLKRWAKAFHYRETGVIVPSSGRIAVIYFSNANAHQVPEWALNGKFHELKRNGKNIGDQFAYVTINESDRPDLGIYTAAFRRSFLALMMVDFHGEIITDCPSN